MTSPPNAASKVPPLCPGDKLTRAEFERRYQAMPELKKAELIEGIVYTQPRVPYVHGRAHALLSGWVGLYSSATPGTDAGTNSTLRLDMDNEPQPDVLLRYDTPTGASRIDSDDFVEGAPELIVEVTLSSVSYDLHQKFAVYRRRGVREYLVYRTDDQAVDWFALHAGSYERLQPDVDGLLRSEVFPGLWLDVPALLRDDTHAMLAAIGAGTATPEHAAFCRSLAQQPPAP